MGQRAPEVTERLKKIAAAKGVPTGAMILAAALRDPEGVELADKIGKMLHDHMIEYRAGASVMIMVTASINSVFGSHMNTTMSGAGEALDLVIDEHARVARYAAEAGFAHTRAQSKEEKK